MLHKILTLILTVSVAILFESTVVAESEESSEITVNHFGSGSFYMGQYNNNRKVTARESDGSTASEKKAKSAYLRQFWKGEFGTRAKSGKITAVVKAKWEGFRDADEVQSKLFRVALNYQATDPFSIKLGTNLTTPGATGLTAGSGLGGELTFGMGITHSLIAYHDVPGVQFRWKVIGPFSVYGGIFTQDPLFATPVQYQDGMGVLQLSAAHGGCTNCKKSHVTPKHFDADRTGLDENGEGGEGTGRCISFFGPLSKQLLVGGAYVQGISDQHDGADPWNSNAFNLTARYTLENNMSFAADYGFTKREYWTGIKANDGTKIDAWSQFTGFGIMAKIPTGPGFTSIYYHQKDKTVHAFSEEQEALSKKGSEMTVVYDMPINQDKKMKSGMKVFYLSDTTTPKKDSIDPYTQSLIGFGLYATY